MGGAYDTNGRDQKYLQNFDRKICTIEAALKTQA
jgi:hypothetical protein